MAMDRCCTICGFFVDNQTTTGDNVGYCLFYDEKSDIRRNTGESLKIPDGEEKEIAQTCKGYFRKVPSLSMGEFLNWRIGILAFNIQKRISTRTLIVTLLAMFIACLQLYMAIK